MCLALEKLEVRTQIIEMIRSFHQDMETKINVDGGMPTTAASSEECPQTWVLHGNSPI